MAHFAAEGGVLTVSVVVCGAARSGKSSLLRGIHERLGAGRQSSEESPSTQFVPVDWLPLELGTIGERRVVAQLYAAPELSASDGTRRMLFRDADGVIFVADAQAARFDANLLAFHHMTDSVQARGADGRDVPIVLVYTKTDLPTELVLPPSALDESLNFNRVPSFVVDAVRGTGVREALQALLTVVLRRHASPIVSDE